MSGSKREGWGHDGVDTFALTLQRLMNKEGVEQQLGVSVCVCDRVGCLYVRVCVGNDW